MGLNAHGMKSWSGTGGVAEAASGGERFLEDSDGGPNVLGV